MSITSRHTIKILMTNLNIISVITLLGIFQGIVLLITLFKIKDGNKRANKKLTAFLVTILITLSAHILYLQNVFFKYPHITLLMDHLFFLYGPLLFIYIEDLLNLPPVFAGKRWIHFIPSFIYFTILLPYAFMSPEIYLKRLLTGDIWQYPSDQAFALLHILIYLVWSFVKVKQYQQNALNQIANAQWLKYIYAVLALTFLSWFGWAFAYASSMLNIFQGIGEIAYSGVWSVMALISCTFGFYSIRQPEIFRITVEPEKYKGSTLSNARIEEIAAKLSELMETNKPYLNNRITLNEISDMINENRKDVSRIINEKYNKNFFEFISLYRINEFKRLADPENLKNRTILSLALESGFNSKSAFNSVFKKLTGITPSKYLNSEEKE